METTYFDDVCKTLLYKEMCIFTLLVEEGANAPFKAVPKTKIKSELELTQYDFSRAITRLTAQCFVGEVTDKKERAYYITKYGEQAFDKLRGEM